MKSRDLFKLFIYALPIFFLVSLTNYFVDPANIFKNRKLESDIDQALASGLNVAFDITMSQVDEVIVLKKYIARDQVVPDILVVGSSRCFPVNSSIFPGQKFYNASISSLTLGDMLAITNLFIEAKLKPKTIILGLDPDLFVLPSTPKTSLHADYVRMIEIIDKKKSFVWKFKSSIIKIARQLELNSQIISPSYFQDSVRYLSLILKGRENVEAVDKQSISFIKQSFHFTFDRRAPGGVIFPDGSREWAQTTLALPEEVKLQMIKRDTLNLERCKNREIKFKKKSIKIFRDFLSYLVRQNVNIVIFMPPYHSLGYKIEKEHFKDPPIIKLTSLAEKIMAGYPVTIVGTFQPRTYKNSDALMLDNHHPTRELVQLIFAEAMSNKK